MTEARYEEHSEEQPDSGRHREVPALLRQAWETATGDGAPLEALGATRALKAHLSTWEAQLVKEAIAEGATWETIGDSVGVSRQAAWDRFHHDVHDLRRQMRKDMHDVRRKYRDEAMRIRDSYADQLGPRRRGGGKGRGRDHDHDHDHDHGDPDEG
ncbi:MAG: hypothetical protein JOZ04_16195 [Acidimicrobiia bacterium]|nr:hypothetical protein [Acidimicrobiia bacterium]